MKIVEVGSLNMDLVVRVPKIPSPGETILGGSFMTFPGGKGANQAVAAARLGAQVTMVGCVGDDAFGSEMVKTLTNEEINSDYIFVHPDEATGVALIQVNENGQNSIAVAPGANLQLTSSDVEKALQSISEIDVLAMPLEIPLETVYAAAKLASQRGVKVLMNPAPAQVLEKDVLQFVDILLPNEHEAALMSGMRYLETINDTRRAAEKLLALGPKYVVVTLGSQGAGIFSETGQETFIPAYPVDVIDTTAAGDCFVGALAVCLCEGKSIEASAEFANAAAAVSVTVAGAQPSLPRRDEVERFIREWRKQL
ncbi:MAG: ribokinase [Anaerolineales bacterium]|nr:ribokinase [Anaerolineales bacterium]